MRLRLLAPLHPPVAPTLLRLLARRRLSMMATSPTRQRSSAMSRPTLSSTFSTRRLWPPPKPLPLGTPFLRVAFTTIYMSMVQYRHHFAPLEIFVTCRQY
jgi:hypothetical protein